jgi:ElaB/YqjD/DUF883 family membrane-anchored ribosome-binding protein
MTEPESPDQVIDDLKNVIHDIEALLAASGDYTGERMQEAKTQAKDGLAAAKRRLGQLQDDILAKAGDALGSVRDALEAGETFMRENPWTTIAVAASVGFVLGSLLTRRRS